MTPTGSCPSIKPGFTGYSPRTMCTSVPQMVVAVIRITASPWPGWGRATSSTAIRFFSLNTTAFIVCMFVSVSRTRFGPRSKPTPCRSKRHAAITAARCSRRAFRRSHRLRESSRRLGKNPRPAERHAACFDDGHDTLTRTQSVDPARGYPGVDGGRRHHHRHEHRKLHARANRPHRLWRLVSVRGLARDSRCMTARPTSSGEPALCGGHQPGSTQSRLCPK